MTDTVALIPGRFQNEIRTHLILNYSEHPGYPLILGIFGPPGNGKTFQLRSMLRKLDVSVHSISAADLEDERAGQPGKLVVTTYVIAATEIAKGQPAAIVIDDFDTTVGEWEKNTGTVNHQQVIAQVMHLADNPTQLEKVGSVRRVPVFLTGNDFSKLYPPLKRPGRMLAFYWTPDAAETEEIVRTILDFVPHSEVKILVEKYSTAPISFFAEIKVRLLREASAQIVSRVANDMRLVVREPSRFQRYTHAAFDSGSIDLSQLFRIAEQVKESTDAADVAHLRLYRS